MSTSLSDPPCLFTSQHKILIITCNMYVLGVQVCISLILHVQMYSTLVPALKRTSVYFIGTSQIRLVSFCKQHISKSKQKPAQKKDIVLTNLNKTACKILSVFNKVHSWPKILNTLYPLSLSNTCLWRICLLHECLLHHSTN